MDYRDKLNEFREDSQNYKILKYLITHKNLSPKQAERYWDCMRLAARISDLRSAGVEIETTKVTRKNAKGKVKSYAVYSIA